MIEFPTRERFVQWLLRQPSAKILAENWTSQSCPLCQMLKEHGAERPAVRGYGDWTPDVATSDARRLPDWARAFVYWIDRVKPRVLTAEDCLFILALPYYDKAEIG